MTGPGPVHACLLAQMSRMPARGGRAGLLTEMTGDAAARARVLRSVPGSSGHPESAEGKLPARNPCQVSVRDRRTEITGACGLAGVAAGVRRDEIVDASTEPGP